MTKALYIFATALFFGGLLYHFAALKTFNFFIPKDAESENVAVDVAYGPNAAQKLDVYRPTASGQWPVLIFVHGGSWKDGNKSDYEFIGRACAAQGYLTLVIGYRLLPQNAFPDFVSDVALAVAWANTHAQGYGGLGDQIYIVGHSAGAYNMVLATLNQHYMKDAHALPVKAVAGLAGPYDFLPLDSPTTKATFGHLADLALTQPINFARQDAPPFLLLHGTADTTVFPKNSRSLARHLNASGGKATLIEYEGVSHVGIMLAIAKPLRGNAPVLTDIIKFFRDSAQ